MDKGVEPPVTVRGAVIRFALAGLGAVLLLGVVAYFVISAVSRNQAIEDAKRTAGLIGRGIVAPELPANPEAHPRRTREQLDELMRGVLIDPIVQVKLWTAGGLIVYSNEPRLIGSDYELGEDEQAALRSGEVEAELSDLSEPENRFERDEGELLEVYFPITDPDGDRLLFESYARYDEVTSTGRDIRLALVPAVIGALALLTIVQIPLAARMARRIRDDYGRREALLRRAVDASDRERRRIAADLHDGVVQRMAGATYSLDALAASEEPDPDAAKQALRNAAATTRASIRDLRTTLIEIYPQSLGQAGGLESAIRDLLARLESGGIATEAEFDGDCDALSLERQQLLYRVVQESLRNTERHAGAGSVRVRFAEGEGRVRLEIDDDGGGFDTEAAPGAESEGHFGLALMRDLVRDAEGEMRVESGPDSGTTVIAELPA
jgi:signal transduction histidine kinase